MKHTGWMLAAVAIGGAFAARDCLDDAGSDPDERLAAQLEHVLCKIGKVGAKDPVKGVRKLGAYLAEHSGDMLKNFGDTIAMIESIRDDKKHDARAYKARDTLATPIVDCDETWNEFGERVEDSPEAIALLDHAGKRLERTLDIIFDDRARSTFRELPRELGRVLSIKLR